MKTRKNLNNFLVMLVFLLATLCTAAAGETLYVNSDGSGGAFTSIQAAINAAVSGVDQIEVAPGTYFETINFYGTAVRLYSMGGPAGTTIDGGGAGSVVICESSEGPGTILEGFTITGGSADNGGGMYNYNSSSPKVTNCTFTGNSSTWCGGGMYNNISCSPTVTNCTFSGNTAFEGGGMHNYRSSPNVSTCIFSVNSVEYGGGGMFNFDDSSPTVTNCTFTGNIAGDTGGMYNSYSSPTVTDCTFSGNLATNYCGGMQNWESSPMVTNCTFTGNSAGHGGGGMVNWESGSPTVTGCAFSGNSARWGGGMYNRYSSPTLVNCTFTGNSSTWAGGGIDNSFSSPTVTNCTFSGNFAGWGGGIGNSNSSNPTVTNCIFWGDTLPEIYLSGSTPVIRYSDVQGGTGQLWFGTGCIDADPLFADADGRLSAGSPCIDAGDSSAVTVTTDLDGNPRKVGLAVDMGAFEAPLQDPVQLLVILGQQLIESNLQSGIENSLDTKMDAALKALDDINQNNDVAAINSLGAFINAVEAQRGNKIPEADADALIAAAQEIIDLLMAD